MSPDSALKPVRLHVHGAPETQISRSSWEAAIIQECRARVVPSIDPCKSSTPWIICKDDRAKSTQAVDTALQRQAAVGLIGPRQVGKTTLAQSIADERPSLYLDLEATEDRAKLADLALFLRAYEDRL